MAAALRISEGFDGASGLLPREKTDVGFLTGADDLAGGFAPAAGRLGFERAVAAALDVIREGPCLSEVFFDLRRYLDSRAAIVFVYVS